MKILRAYWYQDCTYGDGRTLVRTAKAAFLDLRQDVLLHLMCNNSNNNFQK
jgi:hypothetical protein